MIESLKLSCEKYFQVSKLIFELYLETTAVNLLLTLEL